MKRIFLISFLSFVSIISILPSESERQLALRKKIIQNLVTRKEAEKIDEFCKKGGAAVIDQELYDQTQDDAEGKEETSADAQVAAMIAQHAPASIQKLPLNMHALEMLLEGPDFEGLRTFYRRGGSKFIDQKIWAAVAPYTQKGSETNFAMESMKLTSAYGPYCFNCALDNYAKAVVSSLGAGCGYFD